MKDLDHPHSDTPHSTNSDDIDAVYEQFLQSLELELESDEPEVEAVNQKSPPHDLSLDDFDNVDSVDDFDSLNNLNSLDGLDSIEPIDNGTTAHESLLFAEIDLAEDNLTASIKPHTAAADDNTSADKLKTPAEAASSAGATLADNSDLVEATQASAHSKSLSKNLFSWFKKPQLSKALRKKPTAIKAPKEPKNPKKAKIAKAGTGEGKPNAAKNRLMILVLGGLLLTLALVFLLISTDVLSPLTDNLSADTGSEAISPEVATAETVNSEAQNSEIAETVSTEGLTPETNGADKATEQTVASGATADTATGVPEVQNAVISYEEFTEEADTPLYRDTND